jgi:hypothetical protein
MDLRLDDDVLDRIDEIVPPGTEIYSPHEASLKLPWLVEANLRRPSRFLFAEVPGGPREVLGPVSERRLRRESFADRQRRP